MLEQKIRLDFSTQIIHLLNAQAFIMSLGFSTSNFDFQNFLEKNVIFLIKLADQSQSEGNYQEATINLLKALDALYQMGGNYTKILGKISMREKSYLTSLRASIYSKLGDNLVCVGQYKIAYGFYSQQLNIVTEAESKNNLDMALAYHKISFCQYFIGSYDSSIALQQRSLDFISKEVDTLEVSKLKSKIYLCLGLNQFALESYEKAVNSYEEALRIARKSDLQNEEAEIIAYLSLSVREKHSLEYGKVNIGSLEKVMGDLYYVIRIASKNPYIKVLAFRELARVYQDTDIDISISHLQNALNLSAEYDLPFSHELRDELDLITQKKVEQNEQNYILEDQPWYAQDFPRISEIELESLSGLKFKSDFVIITSTPTELKAVLLLLKADENTDSLPCRFHTSNGQYYLGRFGLYNAVVTQSRMGTRDERAANFTTLKALETWKPKAVIMVGTAFGKNPDEQNIGDVLVATEVVDYDSRRIGSDRTIFRGNHSISNRKLLGLFEQAHEWKFVRPNGSISKLIPCPVLSGDNLIDNSEFREEIFQEFPQAKGGEMEGVGFCTAANSLDKPWILVKAICDWADGKKNDKDQPLAAAAAVSLVHYVLSQRTILNCFKIDTN